MKKTATISGMIAAIAVVFLTVAPVFAANTPSVPTCSNSSGTLVCDSVTETGSSPTVAQGEIDVLQCTSTTCNQIGYLNHSYSEGWPWTFGVPSYTLTGAYGYTCDHVTSLQYLYQREGFVGGYYVVFTVNTPVTVKSSCIQTQPATISAVVTVPDINTASVTWTTDVAASSSFCWDTVSHATDCTAYAHSQTVAESVLYHSAWATSLVAGTLYHFRVCSTATVSGFSTCTADSTFTTVGADPRAAPTTTVYDPPTGRIFGLSVLNAYTFRFASSVDSNAFPSETVIFKYEIETNDGGTPVVVYDSPALPFKFSNTYICGAPSDCRVTYYAYTEDVPYVFETGHIYQIKAASETVTGGTFGAWSDWVSMTTEGYVDCKTTTVLSEELQCFLSDGVSFLFIPSSTSINGLFSAVGGFSSRWPISWFSSSMTALAGSTDVSVASLGTSTAGNPLHGELPTAAWWASQLRGLYGSWAEAAFDAVIWLGVLYSVVRTGMAFLNMPFEEETPDG
jgi:hypothetical protein